MKEKVKKIFSKEKVGTAILCLSVYIIIKYLLLSGIQSDNPLISTLSVIGILVLCAFLWFNLKITNNTEEIEPTEPIVEESNKIEEVVENKIKPKAKLRKIINESSTDVQVEFIPKPKKKKRKSEFPINQPKKEKKSEFPINQPKKKRKPKQKKSDSSQNNFE